MFFLLPVCDSSALIGLARPRGPFPTAEFFPIASCKQHLALCWCLCTSRFWLCPPVGCALQLPVACLPPYVSSGWCTLHMSRAELSCATSSFQFFVNAVIILPAPLDSVLTLYQVASVPVTSSFDQLSTAFSLGHCSSLSPTTFLFLFSPACTLWVCGVFVNHSSFILTLNCVLPCLAT